MENGKWKMADCVFIGARQFLTFVDIWMEKELCKHISNIIIIYIIIYNNIFVFVVMI